VHSRARLRDKLHLIDPPNYPAGFSALPDDLILIATFVSNDDFNIEVSQVLHL
jgi:hypothetical protein